MAGKLKITGFARLFVFLVIVGPLIYAGVSLFRGEHPLDAAKRDFGIDLRGDKTEQVDSPRDQEKLNLKIESLLERNESLETENSELKEKIKELEGR